MQTYTITIRKDDGIRIARLLALQIRNMVAKDVHKAAINSANQVLDRFVTAMEHRQTRRSANG
jgi:hypothetical protein